MSLFIGKANNGMNMIHITNDTKSLTEMKSDTSINSSIIHTLSDTYLQYDIVYFDIASSTVNPKGSYTNKLTATSAGKLKTTIFDGRSYRPYILVANSELVILPSTYLNLDGLWSWNYSATIVHGTEYIQNVPQPPSFIFSTKAVCTEAYAVVFNIKFTGQMKDFVYKGVNYPYFDMSTPVLSTYNIYSQDYNTSSINVSDDNINFGGVSVRDIKFVSNKKINDVDKHFRTFSVESSSNVMQLTNSVIKNGDFSFNADADEVSISINGHKVISSSSGMSIFKNGVHNILWKYHTYPFLNSADYVYYGDQQKVKIFDIPDNVVEFILFYCYRDEISSSYYMSRNNTYAYAAFTGGIYGGSTFENAYLVCEGNSIYFWNSPPTSVFPEAYSSVVSNSGGGGIIGGVTVHSRRGKNGLYAIIPVVYS